MTIQPPPRNDHSSLDDSARDTEDQNASDGTRDSRARNVEAKKSTSGGQISEAGGASLNAETSGGGADAVPDAHG